MEECEALCTSKGIQREREKISNVCICCLEIGIMKLGQFVCFGNLQRLKNRFGSGYAVQVKLPLNAVDEFKDELMLTLPGVEIEGNCTDSILSLMIYTMF